jgi:hypothetical protein
MRRLVLLLAAALLALPSVDTQPTAGLALMRFNSSAAVAAQQQLNGALHVTAALRQRAAPCGA